MLNSLSYNYKTPIAMTTKHQRELATEKMKKLLFKQSTPAIIGLLMMSLYNVVDTIFVGQSVGALGIAALAIAAPIQMIIISIAQTIGVGSSSIISRALGAKHTHKAEAALGNFLANNNNGNHHGNTRKHFPYPTTNNIWYNRNNHATRGRIYFHNIMGSFVFMSYCLKQQHHPC